MSEPGGTSNVPGYGSPPGQPAYGEPVAYREAPAPPPGQASYRPMHGGPQQYRPQQYWPQQQYGYAPPVTRPSGGTVITAAVIQIVQASLFVIFALAILFVADMVNGAGDEFDRQVGGDASGITDSISRWVAIGGLLLLACAVFMIVLAALAIRGRRWAAIVSVVLQTLSVVLSLVGLSQSGTGDSPGMAVVFTLASITVVTLFLLPASTAYFAARTALSR